MQWGEAHEEAFDNINFRLCCAPVLADFDPLKQLGIQCDSSQFQLGAVVLPDGWSLDYCSRTLSDAETRFA